MAPLSVPPGRRPGLRP